MPDSDGNFSNNFLELAGATGKKRKRHDAHDGSSKSEAKLREAVPSMNTTSDFGCEDDAIEENPYPLDGKYIDEYDRQLLLEMPELEREEIVLQRFEEVQRIKDMRNLDQMLRVHKGGAGDSSAKAAKHQHPGRGATNGKPPNLKIEKLRARRKAKQEAKRKAKEESNQVRGSPARSPSIVSESRGSSMRDRSLSPMDSEASDEEAEITKSEQKGKERKRKPLDIAAHNDESITIADISKVRLTRDTLSKYFLVPWFNEYVKGAYVRYPVGENKHRIYEICYVQIHSKPYNIKGGLTCNLALGLKHGTSTIVDLMDRVSDEDFNEGEFSCFKNAWEHAQIKLPTKRDLKKKGAQMSKLMSQSMTNNDIAAMLRLERRGPEWPEHAPTRAQRKGEVETARQVARGTTVESSQV